jgi:hypothetical protein
MTDHTAEADALWARLLAEGKVAWALGLVTTRDDVVIGFFSDGTPAFGGRKGPKRSGVPMPKWSSDATIGCLLGMVRRAWGEPSIHLRCYTNALDDTLRYQVFNGFSAALVGDSWPTEAPALLRALEAAP